MTSVSLFIDNERHRKLGPCPYRRSFEVKDINRDSDEERQAGKHRGCVWKMPVWRTDVFVKRPGVHGSDTGQDVTSERITAGS